MDTAEGRPTTAFQAASVPSEGELLLSRYGCHLDDGTMSDLQKQELLLALWQVAQSFVDLSFGLNAAQASSRIPDLEAVLGFLVTSARESDTDSKGELIDAKKE